MSDDDLDVELMIDPTAQTGPLTEGQKLVALWEGGTMFEPWELAAAIDVALAKARRDGAMGAVRPAIAQESTTAADKQREYAAKRARHTDQTGRVGS